jgi:hypothetical protein
MVSRRPPNPVEKANPARIPGPNSPLEKTPHKTRVEGGGALSATRTLIHMPAERRGSAKQNGSKDFQMQPGEPFPAARKESVCCGADHIGHLHGWPGHLLGLGGVGAMGKDGQCIQRTGRGAEMALRQMEINSGLFEIAAPE